MVTNLDEIKIIREIFSKYPLNTTKYLNFQTFKEPPPPILRIGGGGEAFEIYNNRDTQTVSSELVDKIMVLKNSMNTQKTFFEMGLSHQINITSY